MLVEQEKAQQSPGQRQRKGASQIAVPQHDQGEKRRHDQRHGGAQTVDAVGQVDGVVCADDDKHADDQIEPPGQTPGDAEEGNIEGRGQVAHDPHHHQKQHRRRDLQKQLLLGRQALILLLSDLGPVVRKAHGGKDQAQSQHHQRPEVSLRDHPGQTGQHRQPHGQNKDDAAHGGRILLALVPGGAILQNFLTEMEPAQLFNDDGRQQHRDDKGQNGRLKNIQQHMFPSPCF